MAAGRGRFWLIAAGAVVVVAVVALVTVKLLGGGSSKAGGATRTVTPLPTAVSTLAGGSTVYQMSPKDPLTGWKPTNPSAWQASKGAIIYTGSGSDEIAAPARAPAQPYAVEAVIERTSCTGRYHGIGLQVPIPSNFGGQDGIFVGLVAPRWKGRGKHLFDGPLFPGRASLARSWYRSAPVSTRGERECFQADHRWGRGRVIDR
jgi:hypothetical protein